MKPRICLSLALAVLLASGAGLSETPSLHPAGGLLFQDPHTVPGMTVLDKLPVSRGAPTAALPSAVDLSGEMPPIGNQGGQASCVAWAIGYYDKTHAEYVEHGWNDSTNDHRISPSFIYNQINAGRNGGVYMSDAQKLICEQGACMWSDMPYNQSDYLSWPSESAYSHGTLYRGQNYLALSVHPSVFDSIKQVLANGQTCVLGINVYSNFDYIKNFDTVYTIYDKYGTNRGGHAVCIVGYDDNKSTADGTGAFRLVNSWGTGWGNAGYWWMSYQAVNNPYAGLSQGYVYVTNDRTGYSPTVLARVKLTHPARDYIGIQFGIGGSKRPLWSYAFRQFGLLGNEQPFPNNNLVFDLSDGASYLQRTDSVYVRCSDSKKDAKTGSIDFLSAEYQAKYGTSPQTPVPIPDFKTAAYAKLVLLPHPFGPQAEPVTIPQSGIELLPNPVKAGRVTVQYALPHAAPITVTLLDVSGRAVWRSAFGASSSREGSFSIDVKGLRAGVYVMKLESGTTSLTRKLVIQ